jgi:hypothetical protein
VSAEPRVLGGLGAGLKGGYLVNPMLAEVHWLG